MKKKHYVLLFLSVLIVLSFAHCFGYFPKQYKLLQSIDNIASVKIMDGNNYDKTTNTYATLKELSIEEGKELITELLELKGSVNYYNPYLECYGQGQFVEIVYMDGEVEQITQNNNFWTTLDGSTHHGGYYFKNSTSFHTILSRYR